MSTSYSGEKIMQRQRVCPKCKSFVTHEKISDKQFACPLCGNRQDFPPNRVPRISASDIARIVARNQKTDNTDEA